MAKKRTTTRVKKRQPKKKSAKVSVLKQDDKRLRIDPANIEDVMNSAPMYISGTPQQLIRDAHGNPAEWLHNAHAHPDDEKPIFLMGRGASATLELRNLIHEMGIPVMAINDYPKDGPKPRYWCAGDPACYYGERIWTDPFVMKFSPIGSADSERPREDAYAPKLTPRDAPNTHFFHARYDDPTYQNWLHVPWINWGTSLFGENTPKEWFHKGAARSSMFIGLRLCWHLGYRRVYLLGCDGAPGHHPAPMYWPTIHYLLEQLVPTFKRYGFNVYQVYPDAHIRCFEFVDFFKGVVA